MPDIINKAVMRCGRTSIELTFLPDIDTMYARVFSVICVLLAIATVAHSRRWYATEVSCWITQEKVPASWEDAQRRCERDGAVLASPLNTQLHKYLQSRLNVQNDSVAHFIGTRVNRSDDGQEVDFVSVEGRRLDDMPMAVFDAIKQLDLEQGDCLSMDRHGIRAVSCWDHLPYICYSNEPMECGSALVTTQAPSTTTSTPPPTSTTTPALVTTQAPSTTTSTSPATSTIPPGYTYYPATGSYYKLHNQSRGTWDAANTACASEGAHLVVLNDAEEADIVDHIVRNAVGIDRGAWIGLRDRRTGGVMDWRTVHGEPVSHVYNVWDDYRPFDEETYTCTYITTYSKRLHDVPCDFINYFTCEISQQ